MGGAWTKVRGDTLLSLYKWKLKWDESNYNLSTSTEALFYKVDYD